MVIPLEGTEGAKMSRLAQFHFFTFLQLWHPIHEHHGKVGEARVVC